MKSYCKEQSEFITIKEFTINNDEYFILTEIYKCMPEVIGFSCYLWNIDIVKNLCGTLKKILPNIKIVLGGPEVSYDDDTINYIDCDIVVRGEGEKTFSELVNCFNNKLDFRNVRGITYRLNDKIYKNEDMENIDMNSLVFPYDHTLFDLSNKIIYYEASRGCPFNCQYCLSSLEKGVRSLDESRVFSELAFFLEKKVMQVKFVDRTFNCNLNYAMKIWKFLIENYNGITNFHFEISADLLNDDSIELLKTAPKGFFQFEIGVQSTNLETLHNIARKSNLTKLFSNIEKIKEAKNIHLHLDLIAGLPNEDYESFKNSFNQVYDNRPEQLQIGFLKLLKGSGLRKDCKKYGIVFNEKAPYEVLYTECMCFNEILKLKSIEEILEVFYNSGKFTMSIKYIEGFFNSPFELYENLQQYWERNNYHLVSHKKEELYNFMYSFCEQYFQHKIEIIKDLLLFDMFKMDNVKNLPPWLQQTVSYEFKEKVRNFYRDKNNINKYLYNLKEYDAKQLSRMCHIEKFNYDILSWFNSKYSALEIEYCETYVLFNYYGEKSFIKLDVF